MGPLRRGVVLLNASNLLNCTRMEGNMEPQSHLPSCLVSPSIVPKPSHHAYHTHGALCNNSWEKLSLQLYICLLPTNVQSFNSFPDTPAVQANFAMAFITLSLMLSLSVCSNAGARGIAMDGYGINNYIAFFGRLPEVKYSTLTTN